MPPIQLFLCTLFCCRDVKLENILLDADNKMKIIDFGLSAFFVPGKRLRVHCGSPSYAAPEIVARKQYDGPPVVSEMWWRYGRQASRQCIGTSCGLSLLGLREA